MTSEEARQIIATWLVSSKGAKGQCGYIEGWFDEEDVEAFRMAIEALQAKTDGDTISRQAAIRKYQEVCNEIKCSECPFLIKVNTEKGSHLITDCKLEAFLHNLPSTERTGKWIRNNNGTWSCSKCYSWIPDEQHHYANFCLYCGANMERR